MRRCGLVSAVALWLVMVCGLALHAGLPASSLAARASATLRTMTSDGKAPLAIMVNAAIVVFREGLEAVLILASLLAGLRQGVNR